MAEQAASIGAAYGPLLTFNQDGIFWTRVSCERRLHSKRLAWGGIMAEQHENKGWLEILMDGGIPQVIAGPAGKAISRLIGAAVEIPAAKMEQIAQGIRDETQAKSKIMETLAIKSAELGMSDPKLLERGLNSMLGKAYREQQNREEVAKKTIEYLEEEPAPASSEGPSDDWMDVFEDYAAKASSDSIRDMFARILAGEIRKPGEFSLAAMHLVSILDNRLAAAIEKVAPFVWDRTSIPNDATEGIVQYDILSQLEDVGILTIGSGFLHVTKQATEHGHIGFQAYNVGVVGVFAPNQNVQLPVDRLSRSGSELFSVLHTKPDIVSMAKSLKKIGASKVLFGAPIALPNNSFALHNAQEIYL